MIKLLNDSIPVKYDEPWSVTLNYLPMNLAFIWCIDTLYSITDSGIAEYSDGLVITVSILYTDGSTEIIDYKDIREGKIVEPMYTIQANIDMYNTLDVIPGIDITRIEEVTIFVRKYKPESNAKYHSTLLLQSIEIA